MEILSHRYNVHGVLLFSTLQLIVDSAFEDHHDSPKGEVNLNVLLYINDVSDIIKNIVNDNGVSSCLKSLWETRLCKFLLCFYLLLTL